MHRQVRALFVSKFYDFQRRDNRRLVAPSGAAAKRRSAPGLNDHLVPPLINIIIFLTAVDEVEFLVVNAIHIHKELKEELNRCET